MKAKSSTFPSTVVYESKVIGAAEVYGKLTDLDMTRLCAEAMGWHTGKLARKVVAYKVNDCAIIAGNDHGGESVYDPLHDDAQCFALVKKFHIVCYRLDDMTEGAPEIWWTCSGDVPKELASAENADLNRAIVECCAKMQSVAKMTQAKA